MIFQICTINNYRIKSQIMSIRYIHSLSDKFLPNLLYTINVYLCVL